MVLPLSLMTRSSPQHAPAMGRSHGEKYVFRGDAYLSANKMMGRRDLARSAADAWDRPAEVTAAGLAIVLAVGSVGADRAPSDHAGQVRAGQEHAGQVRGAQVREGQVRGVQVLTPRTVGSTTGNMRLLRLNPGEWNAEHIHPSSEEYVIVLQGTLLIRIDDMPHTLQPQ